MHKVRRKRFLQKQKKKRRKQQQRLSQNDVLNSSSQRVFKRSGKFVGCNEALDQLFVPAEGEYYRVVHNPPEFNDQLVQSEQQFDGLAQSMPDIPDTIAPGSSIDEQFEHIADWSLSFNINDSMLARNYWKGYGKRKNETQKRNYVTRKGSVMALYRFTPLAGVIQRKPDDDGHVVLVEYEGFSLEDYRVKEFGLQPLTDYRNEKE